MRENPRRMGRKKWSELMTGLQIQVRRAKKVKGLDSRTYQGKINDLAQALRGVLNVIEHRGKKWPPRWPR